MFDVPEGAVCANCKVHAATGVWIGEEGGLAWVHGAGVPWCECCMLKYQVDYAEKRAADLPGLRTKLEEVECKEA